MVAAWVPGSRPFATPTAVRRQRQPENSVPRIRQLVVPAISG